MKQIHDKVNPDNVELVRRDYVANGGWETFLAYEDPEQDILIGEGVGLGVGGWCETKRRSDEVLRICKIYLA